MDQLDPSVEEAILAGVGGWANLAGEGVSLATFAGFNGDGRFLVTLKDVPEPVPALSTVRFAEDDVGARIIVAFEKADARFPIILGRLQEGTAPEPRQRLAIDGERLVLRAEREIELRCGEASILLTRAGKILIRGNYVLTRSRGANKIKGAYVDIN
jgi:hypothetical protein